MTNTVRLNRFLANLGFSSRRKVTELLTKKEVTINGVKVLEPGLRINPQTDEIKIDGQSLKPNIEFEYIILNKPLGIISTAQDEHGRKSVVDLVESKSRLYPVGRLDANSKGLILLTNDGDLTFKLTHPSKHSPKTYQVLAIGNLTPQKIDQIKKGISLKSGQTAPAEVKVINSSPKNRHLLEITLFEGKNHQIRKMLTILRLEILELKRIKIGPISLGNLKPGQSRKLTDSEIKSLKQI